MKKTYYKDNLKYEQAFTRLEEILESMNKESIPLDNALELYEEASSLISICKNHLTGAEKKVELLMKSENELKLDEFETPIKQQFDSIHEELLANDKLS